MAEKKNGKPKKAAPKKSKIVGGKKITPDMTDEQILAALKDVPIIDGAKKKKKK